MSEDTQLTLDEISRSNEDSKAAHIERSAFGDLPVDWTWEKSKDHLEYINSGISDSQNKEREGIPVSRIETIADGVVNYERVGYVNGDGDYSVHKLNFGDLLFSNINSRDEIGKTAIYEGEELLYHGMNLLRIRYNSDSFNPYFAYYIYHSPMAQDVFFRMSKAAVGQSSINQSQMERLFLPQPSHPEQRKIATVLHNVDQAIQKTEEIREQSERLRTGVMQDLFSKGSWNHDKFQETQYGSVPEEWNVRTIGDIANRIGSGGTPNTDKDEYYGGDIAWVKTDDLNSGLVETTKTTITEEGLDESAAKLFPKNTVVFAMYGGSLGQNGRLGMEATMNQACCGIVTDESEIDPYFLHQQLIHRKQQLTALSAGTNQQNISQSMIEKFEVFVPSLEEQSEIVEFLQDIETAIISYNRQKGQLQRLKQGLMQDLLSGTVRTTDTNIEVPEEIAQHG